jgi:Mn2+/Fe2+ NRAMP family transporter
MDKKEDRHQHYYHSEPKITKGEVKNMRIDIITGMSLAQAIFWFIMITSASTLHNNGVTNISTAQEAAKALEPLVKGFPHSGQIAGALFAAGIIGTGLLAVPVLAASASYTISESFGWKEGLYKKFVQAPRFYSIIVASTVIGLWINFSNIDPIQALVYTAVINGFVSVPVLIVVSRISNNKKILGDQVNKKISNVIVTITIVAMASASAAMVAYNWI